MNEKKEIAFTARKTTLWKRKYNAMNIEKTRHSKLNYEWKLDAYKEKSILGYRRGKICSSCKGEQEKCSQPRVKREWEHK